MEHFEKFPGLGEVQLNEGGKVPHTIGKGQRGKIVRNRRAPKGFLIGFFGRNALALFGLKFDLGRDGVSLDASGQGGGQENA